MVACFGVGVSVMFHLMFVHYTFSSVCVDGWPPFGRIAGHSVKPFVLIVHCLPVSSIISQFGFESRICLLVVPVPVR